MVSSVHIHTLAGERLGQAYLLSRLSECWREQGLAVTVGPATSVAADVGIVHVDQTWVSADSLPTACRQ